MKTTATLDSVMAMIVNADPLVHAGVVFDLIHTHEGAGDRGIDPIIVERHRETVTAAIIAHSEIILRAPVDVCIPATIAMAQRVFSRSRIQASISMLLHHTHLAMVTAGLSSNHQRIALAPTRSMFAAALADNVLSNIERISPAIIQDLEQRSIAA